MKTQSARGLGRWWPVVLSLFRRRCPPWQAHVLAAPSIAQPIASGDCPGAQEQSRFGNAQLPPHWDRPLVGSPAGSAASSDGRSPHPAIPGRSPDVATAMASLRESYTPRRPKRWRHLFIGRGPQIERSVGALEDERAHLVIYGERGRGKTSLANVIAEIVASRGYTVVRYTGSATTSFDAVLGDVLAQLGTHAAAAPERPATIEYFVRTLTKLRRQELLLIIDEFDRIKEPSTREQIAEAIKELSDRQVRVSLLIVGVAESLEALLGAHASIQRNIVGIHVPLMSPAELENLIASGAEATGIVFDPAVTAAIVSYARGLPYYAQLLCLYAGRNAIGRDSLNVELSDFARAGKTIVEEAEPILAEAYDRAVTGSGNSWGSQPLEALAWADCDVYGVVSAAAADAALEGFDSSTRVTILDWLSGEPAGMILLRVNHAGRPGLAFADSTMRQYVLLRALTRGGVEARRAGARQSALDDDPDRYMPTRPNLRLLPTREAP